MERGESNQRMAEWKLGVATGCKYNTDRILLHQAKGRLAQLPASITAAHEVPQGARRAATHLHPVAIPWHLTLRERLHPVTV